MGAIHPNQMQNSGNKLILETVLNTLEFCSIQCPESRAIFPAKNPEFIIELNRRQ